MDNTFTAELFFPIPRVLSTGSWGQDNTYDVANALCRRQSDWIPIVSSLTATRDLWLQDKIRRNAGVTVSTTINRLLIDDLGWSRAEAIETRLRLLNFKDDWDAPGMEGYDAL